MLGADVRHRGLIVSERLHQDVLRRVLHAACPIEPKAARFGAGCPGEVLSYLGPAVGIVWSDLELSGNKDHKALYPEQVVQALARRDDVTGSSATG